MPELARFLFRHAVFGFGIAILFVGMLLALDVGGLWTLLRASEHGLGVAALLTFFVGLTFSSLQMGIAVWQSGEGHPPFRAPPRSDDDDRPLPD